MKTVNNTFIQIHLIDELKSELNIRGVNLDEVIIELALEYILDCIEYSDGRYDKLPNIVKKIISTRIYDMCFMSNKDLFEYENYVVGKYTDDSIDDSEKKVIIQWPESQYLSDIDPDLTHSQLINDEIGLKLYGSSAYLVDYTWYRENKYKL